MKQDIFKNKSWWNNLSDIELSKYIDNIFEYYRRVGYPHYSVSIGSELSTLIRSGNAKLDGKIIRQSMAGLALAWSYHPHSAEVRNGNSLSPMEVFNDDVLFRTCIEKRIKYGDNISDAAIRKSLRKYGGLGVSNFRPTSAATIYDYAKGKKVWDMSGGYGGRMLGAWLSKSVKHYICTEPCSKTFDGLMKMKNDLELRNHKRMIFEVHKSGSESFICHDIDLCFTSPPYFNQEKYSNEPTQSYIKFPKYDLWLDGYLKQTIQRCFECLKETGKLIVNIASTKNYPTLERDFLDICKTTGFQLVDTLYLELSAREHYSIVDAFKYEPVFVLEKE